MMRYKIVIFLVIIVVFCSLITSTAQCECWDIVKQFKFHDKLVQIFIQDNQHGYLLGQQTFWEFYVDSRTWIEKSEFPERINPENTSEILDYRVRRIHAWGDTIVVVGTRGTCFYSDNAGDSWEDISKPENIDITFYWLSI